MPAKRHAAAHATAPAVVEQEVEEEARADEGRQHCHNEFPDRHAGLDEERTETGNGGNAHEDRDIGVCRGTAIEPDAAQHMLAHPR